MIITIDGPAASGKSTIARALADHYGYYYLNSGLLFRGLAYVLLESGLYIKNTLGKPTAADVDKYLDPELFCYTYTRQDGPCVTFKGQVITPYLKTELIDQGASLVSTNWYVRVKLYDLQHALTQNHSLVTDGRDTGTVVFPNADYKFFITAAVSVRAKRWQADQAKKGAIFSYEQAVKEIEQRDARDSERDQAPLMIPKDAHIIDTSNLTVAQVLEVMHTIL